MGVVAAGMCGVACGGTSATGLKGVGPTDAGQGPETLHDAGNGPGSDGAANEPADGNVPPPPDGGSDAPVASGMGPTPPEPGVNFPFPQNRHYANCTYPTYDNGAVQAAYATWKTTLVTSSGAGGFRRVARSASENLPDHTVSEGIGYGMILAVYMSDQALFDDLWHYEQLHLDANQLMNWDIDPTGNTSGQNAATDADEDMAWALLMADKQWGTSPTLGAYLAIAKTQVGLLWANEIYQSKLPKLGDTWGDWNDLNISYFAPAYYRVFASVDPGDDWAAAIQTTYDTMTNNLSATNGNQSNGLVPGFSTSQGGAMNGEPFTYQYDACRTPFRIGLDWCFNGEPRAKAYAAQTSAFFSGIGATQIVDGYNLNGTTNSSNKLAPPFIGPAAVGAMSDATYQPFVQDVYTQLATNNLLTGGQYYAESWTSLSLVMLSGNFIDYTHLP